MKQRSLIAIGVVALLAVLPLSAIRVPRPAPELVFKLANGQEMKLSQFKGKVVALEFLLTTCPHCKRTSGVMRKMYA
ncbi:MAG TPA: redoxin domain-containing protein, partial [Thermopetrobacter sp.]|nr:redoxin domain-containing protein [Thermopetrobacter sp.]